MSTATPKRKENCIAFLLGTDCPNPRKPPLLTKYGGLTRTFRVRMNLTLCQNSPHETEIREGALGFGCGADGLL